MLEIFTEFNRSVEKSGKFLDFSREDLFKLVAQVRNGLQCSKANQATRTLRATPRGLTKFPAEGSKYSTRYSLNCDAKKPRRSTRAKSN